jgi:hypothetical protein
MVEKEQATALQKLQAWPPVGGASTPDTSARGAQFLINIGPPLAQRRRAAAS